MVGGLILLSRFADNASEQERLATQQSRQERVIADIERLKAKAKTLEDFDTLRQSIVATLQVPKNIPPAQSQLVVDPLPVALNRYSNIDPDRLSKANTLIVDYRAFADLRYKSPAEVASLRSDQELPITFTCVPCQNLVLYQDRAEYSTPESVPAGREGVSPESLQLIEQLKYVVVVRTLRYVSPTISGESSFKSGVVDIESTLWNVATRQPLGTVLSRVVNDKSIKFSGYGGDQAGSNSFQALNTLRSQLNRKFRATVLADLKTATGGDFDK